jgi:hypothetical protein
MASHRSHSSVLDREESVGKGLFGGYPA